jgi:hypothetical protein
MKLRKAIKAIRILSRGPVGSIAARASADDRRALRAFDRAALKSLRSAVKHCYDLLDVRSEASSIAQGAQAIVATGDPALMDPAAALDHIADAASLELATLAGDDTRPLWDALRIVRSLADEIHVVRARALQPQHSTSASATR